jgi:HPt (histidine-containing phosphotransfer) domain-containing protein
MSSIHVVRQGSFQHEDATPAEPLIDLVHLSRQTLGDSKLEAELLRLFDRQAETFLSRLDTETKPHQGAKRADLAHMLKGSARAVGAFTLADAVERFEHESRCDLPGAPALLEGVEKAIMTTRAEIARLL